MATDAPRPDAAAALREERALERELKGLSGAARVEALDRVAHDHGQGRKTAERQGAARARGTWYTPDELVKQALDAALRGLPRKRLVQGLRAWDPACGAGNFLVAVAARWRTGGVPARALPGLVHGTDIDPRAVAIARLRLRAMAGGSASEWRRAVRCADSLTAPAPRVRYDLVIGNPPFLSRLRSRTAGTRGEAARLRERFGAAAGGYANAACAFMLLAVECVAPQGRIAMVLPMSVVAAGGAAGMRERVDATCRWKALLLPPPRVFGGGVPTVVAVLERRGVVRRAATGGAWSPLLAAARGVPPVARLAVGGALAERATATADFRQHYYALKGLVREAPPSRSNPGRRPGGSARGRAPVVTVGHVDAAALGWGVQPVRLHGRAWMRPEVSRSDLAAHALAGPWATRRLVPKVLVATQTRAIEAWVDAHGVVLPSTPLISVMPKQLAELWHVAAALMSPVATAFAWWRHAGAALAPTALKLSARQVLELPVPDARDARRRRAWNDGARFLEAWHANAACVASRDAYVDAMATAYGVPTQARRDALAAWWRSLLPKVQVATKFC